MSKAYRLQLLLPPILLALFLAPSTANWQACLGQRNGAIIPLQYDCHMYIYCHNQTPNYKRCPYNQGFSSETSSCVVYALSDCNKGQNSNQGGTCNNEQRPENKQACKGQPFGTLVPYPGDCAKYLICNCEYPTVKNCPYGTWFDNKIKVCNYPQYVDCDNDGSTGVTTPTTTALPGTTSSMTTAITAEISTETSTTSDIPITLSTTTEIITTVINDWGKDCEPPEGMSADICRKYDNGVLLRYPYNCNAYINCTQGCPVMQYCQYDKVFNNFLKICDTPDTAQCIELPLPSPTTTMSTTTDEESSTETTTISYPPQPEECLPPIGFDSDICQSHSSVFEGYPYNCTAYVVCREDRTCLEYCENGKIFNNLLGICDEDIQCYEIPLPNITTTEVPNSSTTTEHPVITTTTLPADVDPDLCEGKLDYTTYPYEKDCTKYLQCFNDQIKVEDCPQGWLFNAQLMLCDEATGEVCFRETTTEQSTTPTTTPTSTPSTTGEPIYDLCLGQPEGTTLPYKENCQKYYFCRGNGHYYIIYCPYNNYYDPYSGNCGPGVSPTECQEPITTTTLSPEKQCANKPTGTTLPYESDCSQYILCDGKGNYYIIKCPYNNYYDPVSGDCGPSNNPNICRETITTTTTTSITSTLTTRTTETTTTPMPELPALGLCGNQSNGELIAYPRNCQKYISCVRPIPIGFYCSNNWYFNEQQQKCVPNWQSSCSEMPYPETSTIAPPNSICKGLKEGYWQPYTKDCQFYYECLDEGNGMLKICPENQYFDPLRGVCTTQVGPEYCKQDFDSTTVLPPTGGTIPTAKPQGICAGQSIGWKISYPYNCTKYIECAVPIPVGHDCPTGLSFSSDRQECVSTEQSDCGLLTTPTTTADPSTKPLNLCTNKPDLTFLPYQQNCAMYIICWEDMEHLAYCGRGEYFNINEMQCWASANENSCRANATTEAPETTTVTSATTPDPNRGPCYEQPEGTKFPYPNNCSKYIVCRDPLPVGYDCPEGLEFSDYYKECVIPQLSDCGMKTTTTGTEISTTTTPNPPSSSTTSTPETCANKPTGTTLPYPEDCSKYYMCLNGQEKLVNCMPNTYYDPQTGECDDISPIACQGSTTTTIRTTEATTIPTTTEQPLEGPCKDESNGYIFVNIANCAQYYMCLEGSPVLCACRQDTFFDPNTKECNRQTSALACKEAISTSTKIETTTETITIPTTKPIITTTTTTPATKPITTTSTSTEVTTTTPKYTTTTVKPEPAQDNICCGKKSGTYLAYPGDHTKYVICKYPAPEVYTCPSGSYYETITLSCQSDPANDFTKPNCETENYGRSMVFEGDCNKYYFCFGNKLVTLTCEFNWYFNPMLSQCVPRDYYTCPW